MNVFQFMKWFGTGAGIVGAGLIAANLPISGLGFLFFLLSSACWGIAAAMMGEVSLVLLQVVFTLINLLGIYRWLLV